jgi:hypothetical protein
VAAQQGDEGRVAEAVVAHLHRVAQRTPAIGMPGSAVLDAVVVARPRVRPRVGVVRQLREEGLEALGQERHHRRELPQDRPELFLQLEQPVGEEVRERRLDRPSGAACA